MEPGNHHNEVQNMLQCKGRRITKKMKKRKNISLFKFINNWPFFTSSLSRDWVATSEAFSSNYKKSKSIPSCAYVRVCDAYSIMKSMEKRKVLSLFKIKKYLISFHLSFIQRLSASSEAFHYNCKKLLSRCPLVRMRDG